MSSSNIINNNDYILDKSSITSVSKEPLGQGGNGAVYKAKYGNDDVVVKKYRPDKIERHAALREEFQKEARVLNSLRHPGIVFFFGLYDDDGDQLAIVLEYMNLGDLFQYYTTKPKLPFSNRLSIIMDIAAAMQYLHNNNNVHQDLKSPNVLLQIKENRVAAKITDFGTASKAFARENAMFGTPMWRAPELEISRGKPSFTSDVYAFGVIISEVMTWVGPFGVNTRNIRFKLSEFRKSYHSITLPPNASIEDRYGFQAIRDLMFNCLDLNPDNRPIFREINQKLELIKEKLPDPVVVNLPKTDSIYSSVLSSSTTAYTRSDNKPLPPPIIETTYVRKDSGQTRKIRICIIWTVVVIVLLGGAGAAAGVLLSRPKSSSSSDTTPASSQTATSSSAASTKPNVAITTTTSPTSSSSSSPSPIPTSVAASNPARFRLRSETGCLQEVTDTYYGLNACSSSQGQLFRFSDAANTTSPMLNVDTLNCVGFVGTVLTPLRNCVEASRVSVVDGTLRSLGANVVCFSGQNQVADRVIL